MELPKVIINGNYSDFLNGKEVQATFVSDKAAVEKGMHVMGFHNSIAGNTGLPVPREKQSHYIGVEGVVTEIEGGSTGHHKPRVKVLKV
jgi:hypothetical protein